jgi:hypothetical protein
MTHLGRLFFFFLLAFTQHAFSQHGITRYQSFAIDNKEVAWLQVYHHDDGKLAAKLFEHLKRKVWITNITYDGDALVADLVNYRPDYKRYGGKFMNTSSVIRTGKWGGKVRISFKEEKYRVVIYGLTYNAMKSTSGSGKATIQQHPVSGALGELVLNDYRNAFRKARLKDLDILHLSFKDSFTLTINQLIDSDW